MALDNDFREDMDSLRSLLEDLSMYGEDILNRVTAHTETLNAEPDSEEVTGFRNLLSEAKAKADAVLSVVGPSVPPSEGLDDLDDEFEVEAAAEPETVHTF